MQDMTPITPDIKKKLCRAADITGNVIVWGTGLVLLYIVLLFAVFDTFHTPSGSMYPTLQPEDRGYVNKLKLGGRYFDIFAADAGEPYTIRRMPGYGKLERNDVIVFNCPYRDRSDSVALNTRLYYCKRVAAVAGDTLEIAGGRYKVRGYDGTIGVKHQQTRLADYFRQINTLYPDSAMPGWAYCQPYDSLIHWTVTDYGPLVIPAEGTVMSIDRDAYVLYRKYIEWETGQKLQWRDSVATINDKPLREYTFTENYCFAAGDNVLDSKDSRYWGLLPENFIVGVAEFIINATDKSRILKPIK